MTQAAGGEVYERPERCELFLCSLIECFASLYLRQTPRHEIKSDDIVSVPHVAGMRCGNMLQEI